ncbi:GDP-mannose 4,6-dehydratase [Gammaproteobacteria bacterium]|nr:GDP-mannose 4,6-dehydratase [Gammaproteobacteria bacterium]
MSKFLILGSNSFAGSNFVDSCISLDNQVLGINRSPETSKIFLPVKDNPKNTAYKFLNLDINKNIKEITDAIGEFKPEYIVDFAGQGMVAESWQDPHQWYQTNIVAKAKLHKYLINKTYLKKYIRISTPEVYGSNENLITEEYTMNPTTPYAISHMATDLSIKVLHKNFGFPIMIGRFANFYGPHQQLYRIIPKTIISILNNQVLNLHGGGKSVRAFIHADDVSNGIMQMVKIGEIGGTYHFSPNDFYSIKDLVMMICNLMGADFYECTKVTEERPGKDFAYLMDSSKSSNELKWQTNISLESGISQTIDWVQSNLNEISNLSLEYLHKE